MMVEDVASTLLFAFGIASITYFLLINGSYIALTGIAIRYLRKRIRLDEYESAGVFPSNRFLPGIAVVVPAYNEEAVIADSIEALSSLEYPFHEVIVVNDGSTDGTVDRLLDTFELEVIDAAYPIDLNCEAVNEIYRDTEEEIVLIDKENGGKADALNAGLFFTEKPLFCAIDADSLIERGALKRIVEPFLTKPIETVATGGSVRIANGTSFEKGAPSTVGLPSNRLVRFQVLEYLRAFYLGRTGLSRIGGLLVISGAFGLFKTDVVRDIGGYDTDSVTEDMELVVRLHRHLIKKGRSYRVAFLPQPIVWTEAPSSLAVLSRQRRRWFRGLLDTLVKHRGLIGRPSYGIIGLFAMPFFLFVEALGRLVEGIGYVLVPVLFLAGLLELQFFGAFLFAAIGLGAILTGLSVFGEVVTYRRYESPADVMTLLGYAIIESFSYRPWRAFVAWRATVEYLTGDKSWGKMTRTGFGDDDE